MGLFKNTDIPKTVEEYLHQISKDVQGTVGQ